MYKTNKVISMNIKIKTSHQTTCSIWDCNMFFEWMSEDSIFMVNVEQLCCVPDEKDSPTHVNIVYFSCTWGLKMRKIN